MAKSPRPALLLAGLALLAVAPLLAAESHAHNLGGGHCAQFGPNHEHRPGSNQCLPPRPDPPPGPPIPDPVNLKPAALVDGQEMTLGPFPDPGAAGTNLDLEGVQSITTDVAGSVLTVFPDRHSEGTHDGRAGAETSPDNELILRPAANHATESGMITLARNPAGPAGGVAIMEYVIRVDADMDGIPDASTGDLAVPGIVAKFGLDRCPDTPEDQRDTAMDNLGCTADDPDNDGITGTADKCPRIHATDDRAGDVDGDGDGCPDTKLMNEQDIIIFRNETAVFYPLTNDRGPGLMVTEITVDNPAIGTVSGTFPGRGPFTFTPEGTETGSVTLTIEISDALGTSGLRNFLGIRVNDTDMDGDGKGDLDDICPERVGVLENGCPSSDPDGDKLERGDDRCPQLHATNGPDGMPDTEDDTEDENPRDGCPDNDPDGDLVIGDADACPDTHATTGPDGRPKTADDTMDESPADGCPDIDAADEPAVTAHLGRPVVITPLENDRGHGLGVTNAVVDPAGAGSLDRTTGTGEFTFTPTDDTVTAATITFTVQDSQTNTDTSTAAITYTDLDRDDDGILDASDRCPDDMPDKAPSNTDANVAPDDTDLDNDGCTDAVIQNDTASTNKNVAVELDPLANDTGAKLTVTGITFTYAPDPPGQETGGGSLDSTTGPGPFMFTPPTDYTGTVTFTFAISDGPEITNLSSDLLLTVNDTDMDNDGMRDKADECPEIHATAGPDNDPAATGDNTMDADGNGCPDSDNDGDVVPFTNLAGGLDEELPDVPDDCPDFHATDGNTADDNPNDGKATDGVQGDKDNPPNGCPDTMVMDDMISTPPRVASAPIDVLANDRGANLRVVSVDYDRNDGHVAIAEFPGTLVFTPAPRITGDVVITVCVRGDDGNEDPEYNEETDRCGGDPETHSSTLTVAVGAINRFGDTDGDGVQNRHDRCPGTHATNGPDGRPGGGDDTRDFNPTDGCPDVDTDGDGRPDAADKCPDKHATAGPDGVVGNDDDTADAAGNSNGQGGQSADGCPDAPVIHETKEYRVEEMRGAGPLDIDVVGGDTYLKVEEFEFEFAAGTLSRHSDTHVRLEYAAGSRDAVGEFYVPVSLLDDSDTFTNRLVLAVADGPDADSDGVADARDLCANTAAGTVPNIRGCIRPAAAADTASVTSGAGTTVDVSPLANDTGEMGSLESTGFPITGTLGVLSHVDGQTLRYDPHDGASGTDTLSVPVSLSGEMLMSTLTVTVTAPPPSPSPSGAPPAPDGPAVGAEAAIGSIPRDGAAAAGPGLILPGPAGAGRPDPAVIHADGGPAGTSHDDAPRRGDGAPPAGGQHAIVDAPGPGTPAEAVRSAGNNDHLRAPTFGTSLLTGEQRVECGYSMDGVCRNVAEYHVEYERQVIETGSVHDFALKAHGTDDIEWFQIGFGVPGIGSATEEAEAMIHVEVSPDYIADAGYTVDRVEYRNGNNVIGEDATFEAYLDHCAAGDADRDCVTLEINGVLFREQMYAEPFVIFVMDENRRTATHYMNDGLLVRGESLNPAPEHTMTERTTSQGAAESIMLHRTDKLADVWEDGAGHAFTRNHSGTWILLESPAADMSSACTSPESRLCDAFDKKLEWHGRNMAELRDSLYGSVYSGGEFEDLAEAVSIYDIDGDSRTAFLESAGMMWLRN